MDRISRIILWLGRLFPEAFARQLGNPTGLAGRAVGFLLNRAALETKERALKLLDLDPGHRVLEIGFGGGSTLEALHELVPTGLAAGIEISDTMVQAARVRFRRAIAAGRIEVSSASVARIPVDDASFDRALAINTVYFWEDPLRGLEEIARVLMPGGCWCWASATSGQCSECRGYNTGSEPSSLGSSRTCCAPQASTTSAASRVTARSAATSYSWGPSPVASRHDLWDPAAGGRGHPPPLRPTAFAARAAFRGACMVAKPRRRLPVLLGI